LRLKARESRNSAAGIADAETKLSELPSAIEEATAIREKEAAEFATLSSELKTNIAAIGKAVAALQKGAGGAFLQTASASTLKNWSRMTRRCLTWIVRTSRHS
jgi:hypothetical protein